MQPAPINPVDLPTPAGYRVVRERTRPGATARVVEAIRDADGAKVALRIAPPSEGGELLSELAVLSAVEAPGLARLIDFGASPGGGVYAAREWIDGVELGEWARTKNAAEIAGVAARLCLALDHLHARGFVHGDLKAGNVIVVERADGAAPVLTDFGLARTRGDQSHSVAGTLFHIAPEVLFGAPIEPGADLFALGVLLHELLVRRRPSAREFYGLFPASSFLEATRTTEADLPELLRDCVVSLLERDKSRRPPSAAHVGRTLAGRAGIQGLFRSSGVELRWPTSFGREAWIARVIGQALTRAANAASFEWLVVPPADAPQAVSDACALELALRGARVLRWDVASQLRRLGDAGEVDRWAREQSAQHAGVWLFAALDDVTPSTSRALDALAQAIRQTSADVRPAGLVVTASGAAPTSDAGWSESSAPAVDAALVERFLREHADASDLEPAALRRLAQSIADACEGAAALADRALAELIQRGSIVAGDDRPRLRAEALEAPLALAEAVAAWPRAAAEVDLLGGLFVFGDAAPLHELAALTGLARDDLQRAATALVEARFAAWVTSSNGAALRVRVAPPQPGQWVDEARWRDWHGRFARLRAEAGAPPIETLPHALRAGIVDVAEVVEHCEQLRESGAAEFALRLSDAAIDMRVAAQAEIEPLLLGESALAWCALGDADRAEARIEAWSDESALDPAALAAALRVKGQIASVRRDLQRALQLFERAKALDPRFAGVAALSLARLLGELGRDREVLELIANLRAADPALEGLDLRARRNLLAREAMALFRVGEVERARQALETMADEARKAGDDAREAGLRINLATVERRAGGLGRALAHFERALDLYESSGNLAGLAQARAQLGGALRESGQFVRAQPLLESALALRERIGDRSGALAVRGMLGLLYADRGHARSAVEELERAAQALRAENRQRAAILLEARAEEVRARFAESAPTSSTESAEIDRAAEGDPRILVARARALAFRDEATRALEFVDRAGALAKSLGLAQLSRETSLLATLLRGGKVARASGAAAQDEVDLAAEDERLAAELGRAPLSAEVLRDLAADLTARGRDDRAARIYLALAARVESSEREDDARRADERFAACARGLTPTEQRRLRRALLGVPDPWPEDVLAHERRSAAPEDDEMELIQLFDINRRLLAQEDLRGLLGTIVEQALQVSGAQRGFLILEEDGELKVDTALDSRRGDLEEPDVEVSGSVLREALAEMKPVRVSNAVDDPQLGAAPSVIHLELRSILCAPFEVQPGLRGVIYVDHRLREAAFDARVERMLMLLASQAGLAILQVRRLEEIRRLNRELGRQVARKESDLKTAAAALRRASLPTPGAGLVGDSPPMREVRRVIERAATSMLAVLVTGPSGSGKELAARALHQLGARSEAPFVSENCAALPASLIEAELFGARKGAYTGADRDREGLFERAHGGTLFLDEIGELPLDLQAKLLRVLETGSVRRLGDDKVRQVDVRLVAATNRDLAREVNENRFRADLYYRLDGLRVAMPSLAERPEDIPALVDHCLRIQAEPGRAPRRIAPTVLTRLCRRSWPGNVRELFNEVARLLVMSEGDVVDPDLVRDAQTHAAAPATVAAGGAVRTLEELEKEAILHALEAADGDKRKAAELLGISRAKVYQRLKDWGLTGPADGA